MNDWIEWKWTKERPYPETMETLIYIKSLSDNYEEDDGYEADTVKFWMDAESNKNIWEPNHHGSITHYRLAKEAK